jgi:glycosyltransferase involved in cell wall biosynthesis
VAVIGAIGLHKGAAVLLDCAIDAAERDLPIEFHVVGYTDRDKDLISTGRVKITGPYAEEDLQDKLKSARCQIAWLPSVWPETYCYTLSSAIQGQLYPLAFDLGAIAERIRALDWGDLLPVGTSARLINDRLLSLEPPQFPTERASTMLSTQYDRCLIDYYDTLEL